MAQKIPKPDKKDTETLLPLVSVIIPFRNNHSDVESLLGQLSRQTWPEGRREFIFIDNASDTELTESGKKSDGIVWLREDQYMQSPYSARNRGIELARGEILVFLDANSTVEDNWLEEGLQHLLKTDSDLVAGYVGFDFDGRINSAKIIDALMSIRMKEAVEERGVAYTANLFVRRELFKVVGLFEEGVRSGGDVRWTLKAKDAGFQLEYCDTAKIYKRARSWTDLYRKRIRTGKGYYHTWVQEENRTFLLYNLFRSLKPPNPMQIKEINPQRYHPSFSSRWAGIWFHLYLTGIIEQLAFLSEYVRARLSHLN